MEKNRNGKEDKWKRIEMEKNINGKEVSGKVQKGTGYTDQRLRQKRR